MTSNSPSCNCISHAKIPRSSRLLLDYLYDFEKVSPFYTRSPFLLESYRALAKELAFPEDQRKALREILRRQNQAFGCGDSTLSNIDRLAEPGTFAVVTGQQVGLFSGPSFALYKALTTIRLAAYLSEQGIASVPVFWAATEDHDLEEVSSCTLLDNNYEAVTLRGEGDRPAPKCPVGKVGIPSSIRDVLSQVRQLLPAGPGRDRLIRDLEECYRPGTGWGKAFCGLMARLFRAWGVVLIDPSDEGVQQLASGVYRQASEQAGPLFARLQERSQALLQEGYHAQVHLQEESTLLFTTVEGNRVALRREGEAFQIDGSRQMKVSEVGDWISRSPQDFSSNVLLRPLVQDHILPTLAYVAGPSELAYLGQAQVLYQDFGRPQPVIFPRAGFTLVDRRIRRWLDKYGMQLEDVWKGEGHLGGRIAAAGGVASGWSERFEESRQSVVRALEGLRKDVEVMDPTLLEALTHSTDKVGYQLDRLQGKLTRSALQRSENLAKHGKLLLRFLFPRNNLQEREVGGIYFLGRAGYELLNRIYECIQVRSSEHQVIEF